MSFNSEEKITSFFFFQAIFFLASYHDPFVWQTGITVHRVSTSIKRNGSLCNQEANEKFVDRFLPWKLLLSFASQHHSREFHSWSVKTSPTRTPFMCFELVKWKLLYRDQWSCATVTEWFMAFSLNYIIILNIRRRNCI